VLADKPWIIEAAQFPALERAFAVADSKGVVAYDCMTQRFEIAYILQRELVNDPEVFGAAIKGSAESPAVEMASTHFLLKRFNGVPNLRPPAYFDIRQQGEAFRRRWHACGRSRALDAVSRAGSRLQERLSHRQRKARPTVLSQDQITAVTGERSFLPISSRICGLANCITSRTIARSNSARGHMIKLAVTWDFESPSGANDTMLSVYRGANSEVMARRAQKRSICRKCM
jgi:hypothetical protein